MNWADRGRGAWPDERRERARALDQQLLSRRGLGLWLGWLGGFIGTAAGFRAAGVPLGWALLLSGLFFAGLLKLGLRAWVEPERFTTRRVAGLAGLMVGVTYAATLAVAMQQFRQREGRPLDWADAPQLLWLATPMQLMLGLTLLLVVWVVSRAAQTRWQQERARLQLVRERDTAARQAAEANLRVLQAQIQPHFIFNTLAALQHWVDGGDERAGPLLRELTAFLRACTDLFDRELITLAEEGAWVGHYLAVQQARLGERLRFDVMISPEVAAQALPPGLLLTLVENAVEHGLAPALAGGELHLRAWRDAEGVQIQLDDTGVGLPASPLAEGVGLRNSRERLASAFGARASLMLTNRPEGGARATIRLVDPTPAPAAPPARSAP